MSAKRVFSLILCTGLFVALTVSSGHTSPWEAVPHSFAVRYDWFFNGAVQGDELGYAVSGAGDVNGDGWDDVIVGAPKAGDQVSKEGLAYIFYGSPAGLGSTPAWVAGGGQKGAEFGAAVGAAGDVNGDGWDDVIVGAPLYGQPETGRVYVFYGSDTGPGSTADWTFEFGQTDARFGAAVGAAGNVNGDAYDDIIVGAQGYDNGQAQEGAAFVFYGSATGPITATFWIVESDQANALFGSAVSAAGDVNGDGWDDVVVGAPQYDDGETDEGAAFVYLGADEGLAVAHAWMVGGDQAEAEFGASVSAAGDVQGDGWDDVVVGAPEYDNAVTDEGAVFGFYGSDSGLSASADWSVEGGQSNSGLGIAVRAAGDVNGDGYGDVIVGAHHYQRDESDEGAAFVFLGSDLGLGGSTNWVAEGNKAETQFGYAVGAAGDVNQDGYADVVVGAPTYRIATYFRGRAFAYHGSDVVQSQYLVFLPLVLQASP